MAKEFFKDLPDTSTPINSARLNGLLNGNESMGSIVVEDVTCKNLFNVQQAQTTNAIINSLTRDSIVFSDNGDVWSQLIYKLVLKKNTIYTLKYTFETTNPDFSPYVDIQGNGDWHNSLGNGSTGTNVITFNSGDWDYINISFPIGGATNITNTGTLSNVQIEKGSVATEYVPYKNFDNTYKNDVLLPRTNVETGVTYTLVDGKRFSDFNLIEFSTQKANVLKSYQSLITPDTKHIQLVWYENIASGKTELIIEIEYISDTQFKCTKAGYTGDGNNIGDNPYPLIIRGLI